MFKSKYVSLIAFVSMLMACDAVYAGLVAPPSNGDYTVTFIEGSESDRDFIYYDVKPNYTLSPVYYKISYDPTDLTNNRAVKPSGPIVEDFVGNTWASTSDNYELYSANFGGAINNNNNTIDSIKGDFIGNVNTAAASLRSFAGAIYNYGDVNGPAIIGDIYSNFIENKSIATNYAGSIGALSNLTYGVGARASIKTVRGSFINNGALSTNGYDIGGALYSYAWSRVNNTNGPQSIMGNIYGDFIANHAVGVGPVNADSYGAGGAIYQHARGYYAIASIGNIYGHFIGTYATSIRSYAYGGAIDNLTIAGSTGSSGTIGNITGDFIGNYAVAGTYAYGGAIHLTADKDNLSSVSIGTISGSFIGNSASTGHKTNLALGGAIMTTESLTFEADGKNHLFSGNYTQDSRGKLYVAIDLFKGTLKRTVAFNVKNNGTFTINDQIVTGGAVTNGAATINYGTAHNIAVTGEQDAEGRPTGSVTFNNLLVNIDKMNVTDTTLRFGSYEFTDPLSVNGNLSNPGTTKSTLTLTNSILHLNYDTYQALTVGTLNSTGNSEIMFSANFATGETDKITATSVGAGQSINLRAIDVKGFSDAGSVKLFTNAFLGIANIGTYRLLYDGYAYSLAYANGTLSVDQNLGVAYPIYVQAGGFLETADFESNNMDNKSDEGIVVNDGTVTINESTFSNNTNHGNTLYNNEDGHGGVILNGNTGTGDLLVMASSFVSNGADGHGGVISNTIDSVADIQTSVFTGNHSGINGGAVYNAGDMLISSSRFENNTTDGNGGAVYNDTAGILSIDSSAFSENTGTLGSAVYNAGTATVSNSAFTNNTVYNATGGTIEITGSTFANTSMAQGIYNGGNAVLTDTVLTNSTIYNADELTFAADQMALVLNGGNAIVSENGTVVNLSANATLTVQNGGLVLADDVSLNLNATGTDGIILWEADLANMSGGSLNVHAGTLKMGNTGVLPQNTPVVFNDDVIFDLTSNGTVGKDTPFINTISVNNLVLNKTTYARLDVDLKNGTADNFLGTKLTGGTGNMNIRQLLVWNDMDFFDAALRIPIADNQALINAIVLDPSQAVVYGPLYTYDAAYDNGALIFNASNAMNPSIFIGQVAAQVGGFMNQTNAYNQAFIGFDDITLEGCRECVNCGLWARPYGYRSKIDLGKEVNVKTNAYGVYAGFDTPVFSTGKGWEHSFTYYVGYNALTSKYNGIKIEQEGGLGGAAVGFYKNDFFALLTANAGYAHSKANGSHGGEKFNMTTAGVAARVGYNIPLVCSSSIQPILNASYSYINTNNYTNAAGVRMTSETFTPIQIGPEVRFIADLLYEWQVRANASMVWTLNNKTDFRADGTDLPTLSIDPYVQYGAGIGKQVTNRFNMALDVYAKSLGVDEVGMMLTLRWDLGTCGWMCW